jgi:ribosomal protein S6
MLEVENKPLNKDENRVYELGYLLVSTLSEEDVPREYGNLKEVITSMGGALISDEMPRMTTLSYTMMKVWNNQRTKFDNAYFGWIKFEIDSEKISELKKKLSLNENLIRFLTIKTVRENTIASRRFTHKEGMRKRASFTKKEEEVSEPVEINKEEIDKEIDALVEAQ